MAGFPLNNVTTTDAYTEANTSVMDPARVAPTIIVTGASAFYQVYVDDGIRGSAGQPQPEAFAPPGRYSFDPTDFPPSGRCRGIRVRSAVTGTPAQVTVH
jgi:hypothetical protein